MECKKTIRKRKPLREDRKFQVRPVENAKRRLEKRISRVRVWASESAPAEVQEDDSKQETSTTKKQIPLRLAAVLYKELATWAEDEFRSVNGQIEYLLHECVAKRRRDKKKKNYDL